MTKDIVLVYGIIYKCTNLINGKIYIGQTTKSLNHRRKGHEHASASIKKKSVIHFSIRKHGIENFKWEIIDSAQNRSELNYKEIFYIKYFNTLAKDGFGYNLASGGSNGNMNAGKTEEEKRAIGQKCSLKTKGVPKWDTRVHPRLGVKHDFTTKAQISKSLMGNIVTDEARHNLSIACSGEKNGMYGKHHSEELKENQSKRVLLYLKANGHPGRKRVVYIETGVVFNSFKEAALALYNKERHYYKIKNSIKNGTQVNGYSWKLF